MSGQDGTMEIQQWKPAHELDAEAIGKYLLRLPLVAEQLGHANLRKTFHYLHADSAECQFVLDLLYGMVQGECTTEEFADKWYGGPDGIKEAIRKRAEE